MIFLLALKNLGRNLRRTALTEVSILVGVFFVVFVGNFIDGMQLAWAKYEIESTTGAFQVEHKQYRELRKAEPLKVTLDNADALLGRIRQVPGVKNAYGKLEFAGMVSNGERTSFFKGVAVDGAQQAQTLPRQDDLIVQGKPLSSATGVVVLGADLAAMLNLKIGDPVSVLVRTYHGSLNLMPAVLVGTKNGRHFPSSTYLEMTLPDAQRLLRVEDRVSQIVVATHDFEGIPQAKSAVDQALAAQGVPAAVFGYELLIPIYVQALALFKAITVVVGTALFVLVGSGIGNVMAMAVMERRREIGTLAAIGMNARQIRRLFLAEGAMAGVLGAVAGVLLVSLVTWYVVRQGGIKFPSGGTGGQGIAIAPRLNATTAVLGVLVPSLVAVVSAWWPAAQAARLSPVEALTDASA